MTSLLFRNGALLDPLQPELIPGNEVLVEDGRNDLAWGRGITKANCRTRRAIGLNESRYRAAHTARRSVAISCE